MSAPTDPYQTPGTVLSSLADEAVGKAHPDFEARVAEAWGMMRTGKDQMAVINALRAGGMSFERAKRESFPVFDEALRRMRTRQLPLRILGWSLVALGVGGPLFLLLAGSGLIILSAAPVIAGVGILYSLPNPSRLPEN